MAVWLCVCCLWSTLQSFSAPQFQHRQTIVFHRDLFPKSDSKTSFSQMMCLWNVHRLDPLTQVLLRPLTCTEITSNESANVLMNAKKEKKTATSMWGILNSQVYTPRQRVEKVFSRKKESKKEESQDSLTQQRSCFAMHARQHRGPWGQLGGCFSANKSPLYHLII